MKRDPTMKVARKVRGSTQPDDSGAHREPPKSDDVELGTSESELHALLGRQVREARARRFMTRKALARDSGISLAYLARVESGTGNISLGLLQRLALALSLPIESLLTSEAASNADFTLIVEFLKRQPPERLARIRQQLFDGEADGQRIALIGIRGVGKSTLAPMLADRLGVPFVELNREIEVEANLGVGEIFTLFGQRGYRALERACLERVIAKYPNVVLATGGGVVAESGTYELLLSSFFTIWLQARPRVMFERVLAQHDARIASANLRDEAIENIGRTLEARRPLYELAHASLDTSGKSLGEVVPALLALLPGAGRAKTRAVTG